MYTLTAESFNTEDIQVNETNVELILEQANAIDNSAGS